MRLEKEGVEWPLPPEDDEIWQLRFFIVGQSLWPHWVWVFAFTEDDSSREKQLPTSITPLTTEMVRSNALDEPVEAERSLERDFDVVGIIREKKLEYLQGGPLSDLGFLGFNNEEAREILDKLSDEYGLELPPTGFGGYSSEEHPVLGADFILFKIIRADPDIRQEIYRRGREAGFAIRDPDKYERPSWLTDDFLEKTFLTKAV